MVMPDFSGSTRSIAWGFRIILIWLILQVGLIGSHPGASLRNSANDQLSLQHFHATFKIKRAALWRCDIHNYGLTRRKLFPYTEAGEYHFTGTVCRVGSKKRQFQRLAGFRLDRRRIESDHSDVHQHRTRRRVGTLCCIRAGGDRASYECAYERCDFPDQSAAESANREIEGRTFDIAGVHTEILHAFIGSMQ